MKFNVAFRVDASKEIGIGHLMRCLGLSEELKRRGHKCSFITNINQEELVNKIKKNNKYHEIKSNTSIQQDLKSLLIISKENNIDWIITDHYGIDSNYVKTIKQNGFKVLSIDDTSQMHYHSDVVLNQNIGAEKLSYSSEKYTKFLLGTEYAIIRDELLKRDEKKEDEEIKNILVTLGGTDRDNLTSRIIKNLVSTVRNENIIVILGPLYSFYEDIRRQTEKYDNVKLVKSPKNMTEFYLKSDIAISAGGSSCYEMAYFGIPNIIITIAENQTNIATELSKRGVSIYLGEKSSFKDEKFKDIINELMNNYSLRKTISEKGRILVDGEGKSRIVEFMEEFS